MLLVLQVVDDAERRSALQLIQEEHPTQNIYNLYSHYSLCTNSTPTSVSGLMVSVRISKRRKNRIMVDKRFYPSIPAHIYSTTWSDIYRPLSRDEVMGNAGPSASLWKWLASWKKTELEMAGARCNSLEGVGRGEVESGSEADDCEFLSRAQIRSHKRSVFQGQRKYYSSDSEEDGDGPSDALLLCGPSGCGKTASVYACARQLKIKVRGDWYALWHIDNSTALLQIHEINSSCLRDRSSMLTALREATLSHQMSSEAQINKKGLFSFFQPKSKAQKSLQSSVSLANFSVILLEEVCM